MEELMMLDQALPTTPTATYLEMSFRGGALDLIPSDSDPWILLKNERLTKYSHAYSSMGGWHRLWKTIYRPQIVVRRVGSPCSTFRGGRLRRL